MRRCPRCGKQYPDTFTYCPVEGATLVEAPAPQSPPAVTGLVPCPMCGEMIRPAARKCPHCKEFLDPALREERGKELESLVGRAVGGSELDNKLTQSYYTGLIALLPFFAFGPLLGPVVMLYAGHYKKSYVHLGMPVPRRVRDLFIVGVAWLVLGTAFWIVIIVNG